MRIREPGAEGEGEMGGLVAGDLVVDMVSNRGWNLVYYGAVDTGFEGLECFGMGL